MNRRELWAKSVVTIAGGRMGTALVNPGPFRAANLKFPRP